MKSTSRDLLACTLRSPDAISRFSSSEWDILVRQARDTATRWLSTGDSRTASLWREWLEILEAGTWRKVLGRTRHAQQLRQASPLVTILPDEARQRILAQVSELRKGVELGRRQDVSRDGEDAKEIP